MDNNKKYCLISFFTLLAMLGTTLIILSYINNVMCGDGFILTTQCTTFEQLNLHSTYCYSTTTMECFDVSNKVFTFGLIGALTLSISIIIIGVIHCCNSVYHRPENTQLLSQYYRIV